MTLATRAILILTLMLSSFAGVWAQETTTVTTTATQTQTAAEATTTVATATAEPAEAAATPRTSREIRQEFGRVLRQHPPEVATILTLDPTLLSNDAYLSTYPAIQEFVAANPEVRRNPRYYLAEFVERREVRQDSAAEEIMEGFLIFAVFASIAVALAWLVRTIIEQKRWNRLSRTQTEVHNKILDRFGSSEELLEYIRSAAGTKFLESAPIPLHAEKSAQANPFSRIMWSVQIGVVVGVFGLGMILVGLLTGASAGDGSYALGVIALSIGAGFIASAAVSMTLSRRLGVWQGQQEPGRSPSNAVDETGFVR